MALVGIRLGEADRQTLRTLEPEIIRTLRDASADIHRGLGRAESQRWFGDRSKLWMGFLARTLGEMARFVRTERIGVHGPPGEGSDSDATDTAEPAEGPEIREDGEEAQEPSFEIRLDEAWYRVPLFRPGITPVVSKFHTIVHELTHLILHTDDVEPPCGAANCLRKARKPEHAKRNADNWAFFVDDFR